MKKHGIYVKLDVEQVEHLKKQPNQSEYIRNLIQADAHRETRYDYVWPIVRKYTMEKFDPNVPFALSADLTMKLTRQICGADILTEILEGGAK